MNHFIDSYYSSVFHSVTRLTGHAEESELKALTEAILGELEQRSEELAAESYKGVFVYKVVLTHVFSFLSTRGDEQRIGFLQKILLIHPSHYAPSSENKNPPQATGRQGDVDI